MISGNAIVLEFASGNYLQPSAVTFALMLSQCYVRYEDDDEYGHHPKTLTYLSKILSTIVTQINYPSSL